MAQFPCLPLWTDALEADTGHLSDDEFGKYMRLLIKMWRTPGCKVPNDDAWIIKHLRQTPSDLDNILKPIIKEFCQNDGNWITQKRLQREFAKQFEFKKVQSVRSKSRWRKEKTPSPRGESQPTLPYPKERSSFLTVERSSKPETTVTRFPNLHEDNQSASERATALDESAPARSPSIEQVEPRDMTLAEINRRWRGVT